MNTQTLIEKITKAIAFAYKSDGTIPGVTIASLPHNGSFYVSIVRWVAGEKEVLCSNCHKDLAEALHGLSKAFLAKTPPPVNPLDELSDFIVSDSLNREPVSEFAEPIVMVN